MKARALDWGSAREATLATLDRGAYRLRLIGVTTAGDASTLGFAVPLASNWAAFKNITLHRRQAQKGVSWRAPVLRSTLRGWLRSKTAGTAFPLGERHRAKS
jgi:hypothetical protein